MNTLTGMILAGGKGTRMRSKVAKGLHKVAGVPLVGHVVDALEGMNAAKSIVVTGVGREMMEEELSHRGVVFAHQKEQLGTGHAVIIAEHELPETGDVIILAGDMPLITSETLNEFYSFHQNEKNNITVLTTEVDNPFGYGRIIRDCNGLVEAIVEQKDASEEQQKIKEINSAIYICDVLTLKNGLALLDNNNAQGEYYLTDILASSRQQGLKIGAYVTVNQEDIMGINTREQLAEAESIMQKRLRRQHMENGVTFLQAETTYLGKYVTIGQDTTILPGCYLIGDTHIGEDCEIGPNGYLENTTVNNGVSINNSTLKNAFVDDETTVGPYAYIRPKSRIGKRCKVGDFVEVKNANFGDDSKASHLAYIGDADVGQRVNISCGVIFSNYDGKNKHRTVVGDDAFVGCNVNLIAPVEVENYAYVAAGSTITKNVPSHSLAIARARQENKEGWVEKRGLLTEK